jgi:hypothetical protein
MVPVAGDEASAEGTWIINTDKTVASTAMKIERSLRIRTLIVFTFIPLAPVSAIDLLIFVRQGRAVSLLICLM